MYIFALNSLTMGSSEKLCPGKTARAGGWPNPLVDFLLCAACPFNFKFQTSTYLFAPHIVLCNSCDIEDIPGHGHSQRTNS